MQVVVFSIMGTLLWCTWEDGVVLLETLRRHVPMLLVVVMPDHVHVVLRSERDLPRLFAALKSYSRYLGKRHGARGRTWSRRRRVRPVRDDAHMKELVRYFGRNPVGKGLVQDPLAWPLSGHRDLVGMAVRPLLPRHPDPEGIHGWVSAARKAAPGEPVEGTPFPGGQVDPVRGASFRAVAGAVSSLARVPLASLGEPGPVRDLLFQATKIYTSVPLARVARFLGLHPAQASRALARPRPASELELVGRVLGDDRFGVLGGGDLRQSPSWGYYARFRAPWEPRPRARPRGGRPAGVPAADALRT